MARPWLILYRVGETHSSNLGSTDLHLATTGTNRMCFVALLFPFLCGVTCTGEAMRGKKAQQSCLVSNLEQPERAYLSFRGGKPR